MVFIISAAMIALILLIIYYIMFLGKRNGSVRKEEGGSKLKNCPICGNEMDKKGMISKMIEFPDHRKLLEIYGCTHCYKMGNYEIRACPRCHQKLDKQAFVYASYDNQEAIVKVVVKGCPRCYKR